MSVQIENADANPLVSVVIPCYNHAAFIQDCIASVIGQDYQNLELIIIDDGSHDDSVRMIEEMVSECRRRFVRFEFRARPNKGLPATMNEALAWSQGKYFSYVCSDDLIVPEKTKIQVECMQRQESIVGIFSGKQIIDEQNNAVDAYQIPSPVICGFDDVFLTKYVFVAPSMLVDLDLMKSLGGYDESLFFEDRYMWLKMTHAGYKLMILPDLLVKYRLHDENMSKNLVKMLDSRVRLAEMYKEHRLFPYVMASIYAAIALEYSEVSRSETFRYLAKSLRYSRKVVFTNNFNYALLKMLVPKSVLVNIKKILR